MPKKKNPQIAEKIIAVLIGNRDVELNKRQVLSRTTYPYGTAFDYLTKLQNSGFVVFKDVISEDGNRPEVVVRLGLLGYLYAIHKFYRKDWNTLDINGIEKTAYSNLLEFLGKNDQSLQSMFKADSWQKLCFAALQKMAKRQEHSKLHIAVLVEVANSVFEKYTCDKEGLDLDRVEEIAGDEREMCDLILEGLKLAHRRFFAECFADSEEVRMYIETFGESFTDLSDYEKADVIAGFRYEFHSLVKPFLNGLPEELRSKYREKFKKAKAYQVVCLFKCPKCGYADASLQDARRLLGQFVVKCEECKQESYLTTLSQTLGADKDFWEWLEAANLRRLKSSVGKAYESTRSSNDEQSNGKA
jgi:transcription elongation factor Elf1